ncbi:MAG: hypothetical protein IH859_05480, partial [Chloroflexi bacterium]|nr:hypothetical protein [Chloroflexota bacterium]
MKEGTINFWIDPVANPSVFTKGVNYRFPEMKYEDMTFAFFAEEKHL